MADATVRSEMRMDNRQFMEATKNSTFAIKQVKAESREMAKEIGGANNAANGLAAIMNGNLSQGLASLSSGMAALAPRIMAVLGPIGLIVAAFSAAYAAGRKLFDMGITDFSDKLVSAFGTTTAGTDETARQTAALRARRVGREQAAKIDDESAKLAERRLEGVAKLEADYARETAKIQAQMEKAKSDEVKASLQSRLDMLAGFHAQDVEATKQAEREKAEAVARAEQLKADAIATATKTRTEQIADENERMRIAAMEGADKIAAEYARRIRKAEEEMTAPGTTPEQKALLQERTTMLSDEREKAMAEAMEKPIAAQQAPRLPMRMDSLAAVGGFMGGERVNLPVKSKGEQLQAENNQTLKQNIAAVQDLTTQVQTLAASMTGGVQ